MAPARSKTSVLASSMELVPKLTWCLALWSSEASWRRPVQALGGWLPALNFAVTRGALWLAPLTFAKAFWISARRVALEMDAFAVALARSGFAALAC